METKKQSNILLINETKLFYKFAVPNILSLVLLSSAGIVDAIFIGNYVGEISLAAVNTANPVYSFIWGLSMMVMIGGAVAAGKYFGEKNIKAANEVFTNSIVAVFLVSVVLSVLIFLFADNIIRLIGGSEKTTPIAALYLKTIIPFILFTTIGYGLSVFARVDGFPMLASLALIMGALTNIILDAIFIAVLNMGVKGAAYATGISFIVSFLILFIHFARKIRPKESAVIASLRSLIMPYFMLLLIPKLLEIKGVYLTIPVSEVVTFITALTLFVLSYKFLLKR